MIKSQLFLSFIEQIKSRQWRHCKTILAVSGGLDSMVMLNLFAAAKNYFSKSPEGLSGFDFAVAHCNFQLRAEDSDMDAALVEKVADTVDAPFYKKVFDTKKIIAAEGGNVQIVARSLRYDWFEELRKELNFECIATAHHRQDSVETLLMNFFTGTGIEGLHGIVPEHKRIIRPMLPFSKEDLLSFAKENELVWREDLSNQKEDYLRNKIRLTLLPQIESVFPNAINALYDNSLRFAEVEKLYHQSIAQYKKKLLATRGRDIYIPLRKLVNCKPLNTILYELLKPFGLKSKQLEDAMQLIYSESGKYINLGKYKLIKDRNFFTITPNDTLRADLILIEAPNAMLTTEQFILKTSIVKSIPKPSQIVATEAFIDASQIQFPLYLRPWREGDYFYPFGMGMKKKKIKKLLIDLKIPLHEKEKVWVISSGNKIVWVCGIRADERFKLNAHSKEIIHLQFNTK